MKRFNGRILAPICFIASLGASLCFFISQAISPHLPSPSQPIVFYSNQSRQDLKLIFCSAIHAAHHSVHATFYGITDPDLIDALSHKAFSGVPVTVAYDPRASVSLAQFFPSSAKLLPLRSKGLMHRKILAIDNSSLYLGSANLTSPSLHHHGNFVMGIYSPPLAQFLVEPRGAYFHCSISSQTAEIYLLPKAGEEALKRLIRLIQEAKETIYIALFTFTHQVIADALIAAKQRGVKIAVATDYYSARGSSKKIVQHLLLNGICVSLSQGQQLLHHKWALIDDLHFVMGSANWTKAAFKKNEDFLFLLSPLSTTQKQFLRNLWEILELEGQYML